MNKSFRKIFPFLLAVFVLILDQWSKTLVRNQMALGESIPIISDIFHLTYIENTGVAFGMFSGRAMLFVGLSLVVLLGLGIFSWHEHSDSKLLHFGTALVISGALGNIIDRVMKASVTDMFDFRIWPIFNVADIAVCVGFALLVLYIFFGAEDKNG